MIEYPKECKLNSPIIFDSHAHLTDQKFDGEREELLNQMQNGGVFAVINCGTDKNSSYAALDLAKKYDFLYAAVGIHPEDIETGEDISFIYDLAKEEKCVAIGEIGLDYYYDKSNKDKQIEIFEKQIILSKELDLPIIVHDREAHEDTLNLLLKHRPKGVVHCFSGSLDTAKRIIDIGMYIGVGGVVTFKNAKKLPEIISSVPNSRILIETDSPYLAPEPLRGKICHSGLIPFTAQKLSEILGILKEDVLKLTKKNAQELFGIF